MSYLERNGGQARDWLGAEAHVTVPGELDPLPRRVPARAQPPADASRTHGLAVQVRGLTKQYAGRAVLRDVNLDIAPGQFVAIVGRSGCGKSTLLRHVAALEHADRGSVQLDGQVRSQIDSRGDVRIMFQDARLLPWKRVLDNVALGVGGPNPKERALKALRDVGLADRANDWPAVLSGGQKQRVALARALVHRPRLLLLDEPLGALDALTRIDMQQLIERLWKEQGFTALLVTHDVSEAVALADRVVLIEQQHIALDQSVLLARPRSRGAAGFAALEDRVLRRVLQQPELPKIEPVPVSSWSSGPRFAI